MFLVFFQRIVCPLLRNIELVHNCETLQQHGYKLLWGRLETDSDRLFAARQIVARNPLPFLNKGP